MIRYIFMSSIPQKWHAVCTHGTHAANLYFQIINGTLKLIFFWICFCYWFLSNSQHFLRPWAKLKRSISKWNIEIGGPVTIWHNMTSVQFLVSPISLHPTVQPFSEWKIKILLGGDVICCVCLGPDSSHQLSHWEVPADRSSWSQPGQSGGKSRRAARGQLTP